MTMVLIVDDQRSVRQMIRSILDEIGFEVLEASTCEVAVLLTESQQPDLILCDVDMPGMGGYELLTTLRQSPATAAIPFIFLTSHDDRDLRRQGMELGADDYLVKPFTPDELVRALRIRLERRLVLQSQAAPVPEASPRRLASHLPHELRTPLNGIIGFAQLLAMEPVYQNPAEVVDMANHILRSAWRLEHLIENFLLYEQLTSVMADPTRLKILRPAPNVSVRDTLTNVVIQKARNLQRLADLQLTIDPIERGYLCQFVVAKVAEELVDNAFKFSEAHTPVRVTTYVCDRTLTLDILNQGRGMTPDQLTQIQAFQQFDRDIYEQQGMGLGLALSKRLIEIQGGDLLLESQPGQFFHAIVQLPFIPARKE